MLSLEHVTKTYDTRHGRHHVLKGINLTLERGRNIGILGRNGAGKSTLIRLIAGAERPTTGRVVRNMSVSWPLAFVGAFAYHLTGLDNLKFICRIYGKDYKKLLPFIEDFAELGDLLLERLGRLRMKQIVNNDAGILAGKFENDGLTDPAVTAGDDGNLVL